MTYRTAFRSWVLAFALCVVAVVVCIEYVDRPLADFFEGHLRHTQLWIWLDRALRPLDLIVVSALFFLFGCGLWVVSGHELSRWTETPLLCSWSAMWAEAVDLIFKHILVEAGPIRLTFTPISMGFTCCGEAHWDSFPSGTAAISVAIVSVLWIMTPRWRAIAVLTALLLSVAVVVANYQWISDLSAGTFLGASVGWSTVRLWDRRNGS